MLLVQKEDRDISKTVSDKLKGMLEKCKRDQEYALRGGTKSVQRRRTTLSKADQPQTGRPNAGSRQAKRKRSDSQSDPESNQGPASRTRSRVG